jgi:lipopolysaccharide export system protein LptA
MRLRTRWVVGLVILMTAVAASSASAVTVTMPYESGTITINATEINGTGGNRHFAKGNVHVKDVSTVANTTLEAFASEITITLFQSPSKRAAAVGHIQSAEFVGPVKIVQTAGKVVQDEKTGQKTTVDTAMKATADQARYDGAKKMAYLMGNVKATYIDPSLVQGPATLTGDEATINLDPNLGPDDLRFAIRSKPGVSRLTVTPKKEEM